MNYIYMKILESAPQRYDRGINLLSMGKSKEVKKRIARKYISEGDRVLDVGCGTGTLACLMAQEGAFVEGIDISEPMLDVAFKKIESQGLEGRVELRQRGVAELDDYEDSQFDVVVSTLVFSELSDDERTYTLKHVRRILKDTGRLVIADEVTPKSWSKRVAHAVVRGLLVVPTFLYAQTTTHPVESLDSMVEGAGFEIVSTERDFFDSFELLVARKRRSY